MKLFVAGARHCLGAPLVGQNEQHVGRAKREGGPAGCTQQKLPSFHDSYN
jgi:hypothetical protein